MTIAHKIIIVGTAHPLQCGAAPYNEKQINDFHIYIEQLCLINNVQCIAEEMNEAGMAFHNVQQTIPSKVAQKLNIEHHQFDLDQTQLAMLQISSCEIAMYCVKLFDKVHVNKARQLLIDKLESPVREKFWLTSILRVNVWPTLFIYGSDHAQNMQDLINSIGMGPVLSWHLQSPQVVHCNLLNKPEKTSGY